MTSMSSRKSRHNKRRIVPKLPGKPVLGGEHREMTLGEESERLAFAVNCSFEELLNYMEQQRDFYHASAYARYSAARLEGLHDAVAVIRKVVARVARDATISLGGV